MSIAGSSKDVPNFYLLSGEKLPVKYTNLFHRKIKLSFEWKDIYGNRAPFEISCKKDLSDLPFVEIEGSSPKRKEIFSTKNSARVTASLIKKTDMDYYIVFLNNPGGIDFGRDNDLHPYFICVYILALLYSWSYHFL